MHFTESHALGDTFVLLGRSLRHIFRSLDTIITVTLMPIAMMLLFVYVFGGAIQAGAGRYVDYLLPGILLIAIANGDLPPIYGPGAMLVNSDSRQRSEPRFEGRAAARRGSNAA